MRPLLIAILLSIAGYGSARPQVLVTTSQLADVARNVAQELLEVNAMMGPGVDPHLYRATPQDVQRLQSADLILYHGMGLEGQLAEVLGRFARINPTTAVAEQAIPVADLLPADSAGMLFDPHVWMDVRLFSHVVPVVAEQFAELDPENAEQYLANAAEYVSRLDALHDWIRLAVLSVPDTSRHLVTAHDAFAYFGRAYGIEVSSVQGLSTEAEAGVADIRAAAQVIISAAVPAVFVESTINPRTIQAVLEAVNSAGVPARLGGELYSDAMGPADEPEGTYIGMLIHNTTTITLALGGELPALPGELELWSSQWHPE